MRLYPILVLLAGLAFQAVAEEPIQVTWRNTRGGEVLILNGMYFRYHPEEGFDHLINRIACAMPNATPDTPVQVTIPAELPSPPWTQDFPIRQIGAFAQVLDALTLPDRGVTYFYRGCQLRRYVIKASDEKTRHEAECAEYWLDGKYLGTWERAWREFEEFKWERNSIVDVQISTGHPLVESGIGFWALPHELELLLWKRGIVINKHLRCRPLKRS